MKYFIFIILILVDINLFAQNIWELTHNNGDLPLSMDSPDSNNFFIGVENYKNSPNKTILYKSTNQGKDWIVVLSADTSALQNISCPDSSNIWIGFEDGYCYNSIDGGSNFNTVILDKVNSFEYFKMYNNNIGVTTDTYIIPNIYYILITHDGWKSYEKFNLDETLVRYSYNNPVFINDSILYCIVQNYTSGYFFFKLNINTKEYELNFIDKFTGWFDDLCVINENLLFVCGKSNTLNGGSGHDAIYKSTNGGKNWRRVLDLYNDRKINDTIRNPFGLQSIAFKDSLTGIAVGQFGTIIYTYDGGESWVYESKIPESINGTATMLVRYAGSIPIIATFSGEFFRIAEDNLAPKPDDTLSISGRVWEGSKGQTGIPVSLGYRVTMTDSDGYYKFTRLKKGNYTVKALNKYFDGANPKYYYKPFDYKPLQYDIELTSDTSGFDFNATDLRTYHTVSGYVINNDGKSLTDIDVRFAVSKITADGLGLADTITRTDGLGRFEFLGVESYKTWDITPVNDTLKFLPLKHTIRLYTGDTTDLKFTATPITSVWESTENSKFLIKPNPASDFITIQTSEVLKTSEVYKVQIFDILGIEVMSESIHPMTASHRMNIERLPSGVYYIRIGDKVEKFVKM